MRLKLINADATEMNKQVSASFITILFLLCLVPIVSATTQTLTVPEFDSQNIPIRLNQGDEVKLNVTVLSGNVNFAIIYPDGSVHANNTIHGISLTFTAPITGTYKFYFDNSISAISSKTVTLDYSIISTELKMSIIVVILAMVIFVVGVFVFARRRKTNPETYSKSHVSSYDAMLAKKASEIASMRDSMNVSCEDKKKGILLRCRNAWLSDSQFSCRRSFWQISDIAEASVNNNDSISIRFKDGKTMAFRLATDSAVMVSVEKLSFFNIQTANDAFKAYTNARTQQWVDTINMLISKKTQLETIYCKYCGAKNKLNEPKCNHCGAPL